MINASANTMDIAPRQAEARSELKLLGFRYLDFEFQISSNRDLSLFAAGGTTGGGAAAARGARSTFKLPSNGKGKGRHHPVNFLALAFGAGNLLGCIQY